MPSQRGIHNKRNNEGIMNRTIRFGSAVGRRCVTMTAGNVDSVFGTQYMPKIFSFQVDIVKVSQFTDLGSFRTAYFLLVIKSLQERGPF